MFYSQEPEELKVLYSRRWLYAWSSRPSKTICKLMYVDYRRNFLSNQNMPKFLFPNMVELNLAAENIKWYFHYVFLTSKFTYLQKYIWVDWFQLIYFEYFFKLIVLLQFHKFNLVLIFGYASIPLNLNFSARSYTRT